MCITIELSYGIFEFPAGDWIATQCERCGGYEMAMLRSWLPLFSPGDWVVDVGACFGTHTIWAARHGARVLAFEPVHHRWLARNVAINAVEHLVEVRPVAVSNRPGSFMAEINDPANAGAARMVLGNGIQSVRLDDAVQIAPTILKVDVEGLELDVLAGAIDLLAAHRPHLFIETLEAHAVDALLRELGYTRGPRFNATPTYHYRPTSGVSDRYERTSRVGTTETDLSD